MDRTSYPSGEIRWFDRNLVAGVKGHGKDGGKSDFLSASLRSGLFNAATLSKHKTNAVLKSPLFLYQLV